MLPARYRSEREPYFHCLGVKALVSGLGWIGGQRVMMQSVHGGIGSGREQAFHVPPVGCDEVAVPLVEGCYLCSCTSAACRTWRPGNS